MTYKELIKELEKLSLQQLNQTAIIYVSGDDYYPLSEIGVVVNDDTLNDNQFVLVSELPDLIWTGA